MLHWTSKSNTTINFEGTPEEIAAIEAALSTGHYWMKVQNGNLVFTPAYKEPDKYDDPEIEPYFSKGGKLKKPTWRRYF